MDEKNQDRPESDEPLETPDQQPLSQPDREAQPVNDEQPPRLPFAVVGVGASAGGLEAFTEFLKAMRSNSGMAFVFILHLPPDHHSLVAEVLSRHTKMRVVEAGDGMPVEPNHVYVIRPAHVLTIDEGRLHLGPRLDGPRAANRPIDDFFKSLANEQRERGIAIILSGMGSNGTAGAQAIKAVGGLCIAQDPESAQFPSMPRHLIDAGYADFIVPPKEMPEVLLQYAKHPYASGGREADAEAILQREKQHLREIMAVLRTRMKHDFSGYKKPTVLRRIQRRMGLARITKLGDYAKMLRQTRRRSQRAGG
jgi:two-component system CheB/CheR fusion protein